MTNQPGLIGIIGQIGLANRGPSEGFESGAFDPSDISNLAGLWIADTDYLKQSNAGTGAVTDTDPVGYWEDQSGNGNHLISFADDTTRPTYSETGFNKVTFDGSNDILVCTPALDLYNTAGTASVVLVFEAESGITATKYIFAEADENSATSRYGFLSNGPAPDDLAAFFRSVGSTMLDIIETAALATDQDPHTTIVVDDGSSLTGYVNGSSAGNPSYTRSGTVTLTHTCLGAIYSNSNKQLFSNISVAAVVAYNKELSASEISDLTTWGNGLLGI